MRTIPALALSMLFVSIPAFAQVPQPLEALDGVDTVILLQQGKEVFGKSALGVVHGRFRYLFSTAETKAQFEGDPARYEIQLGGMCARMGGTTTGNPSDYFVHDGKIYIFGSDACHKAFAAAPAKYLAPAPAPMPASPQALQRGLELLNRLAEATGRQQLDNLVAYAETASQVQKRMAGPVTVTTKTTWRFPGDARIDRTMERNGTPATFSTVLTPSAAWNVAVAQNRTFPLPDAARPYLESNLGRHPIAILTAMKSPGFVAAALGPATVGGAAVERVRVRHGGLDAVLGIEAGSGRLHAIEFGDRNIDGEYGTYTVIYSDFRHVNGMDLPHAMRSLFNGQPDDFRTMTIQSIEVNPTLDPSLFTRPAEGGR